MTENYPDYLFEEAARREEENIFIAKVSDEDYQKFLDAAKEKKVLEIAKNFIEEHSEAMKELAAIEAKELIDEALEELDAIVMGGQDTREFYNSVKFIKDVLNRLR
jgi:archaellum biogenesis protein FlaJ (TadC family)